MDKIVYLTVCEIWSHKWYAHSERDNYMVGELRRVMDTETSVVIYKIVNFTITLCHHNIIFMILMMSGNIVYTQRYVITTQYSSYHLSNKITK